MPWLTRDVITLGSIHQASAIMCEPHNLLVPFADRAQGWMGTQQRRQVVPGAYIPIWWDGRWNADPVPAPRLQPIDDEDDASLMQSGGGREVSRSPRRVDDATPLSTQSSSAHLLVHAFRLSREHRVIPLDRASPQSLSAQVRTHWAAPARQGYVDLHLVSSPPMDLDSTADETYIVEFAADRQRQADPADKLILVDIKIQEDNPTVSGSFIRRVLWSRGLMAREDMLHLLSSAGLCKLTTIQCTLQVNHNLWPPGDGVRRQMLHGDFVQLDVLGPEAVPSSHIQLALCEQEAADSQRFLYHASPSPSPEPTTPGGYNSDQEGRGLESIEEEERSPSHSLSMIQHRVKVMRQINTTTCSGGAESRATPGSPHVSDLWCGDQGEYVSSSLPENYNDYTKELNAQGHARKEETAHSRQPLGDITNVFCAPGHRAMECGTNLQAVETGSKADEGYCEAVFNPVPRRIPIAIAPDLHPIDCDAVAVPVSVSTQDISEILSQWSSLQPGSFAKDVSALELSEEVQVQIQKSVSKKTLRHFHLFTDGSYNSDNGGAAWSFVIVTMDTEQYSPESQCCLVGYHTGKVTANHDEDHWHGASHLNAYIAELEALFHAHWWALCNDIPCVHIHYDAMSAGQASAGAWGFSGDNSLATCTRSIAQALDEVAQQPTTYHHIRAHSGDPWNELADATAKATLTGAIGSNTPFSFRWRNWITGQLQLRIESLPTRLALLRGDSSLPECQGQCLSWSPTLRDPTEDALWAFGRDDSLPEVRCSDVRTRIKCCTYNVRTLKEDPLAVTAGACEFLRAQLSHYNYQIVALQETRARTSMICDTPDYIRIVSAGQAGHDGCELWFNKLHPMYGGEVCSLQHITVIHQEPSVLAVRLRTGNSFLIVISAHAPHSGRPQADRDQWWSSFERLLQRFHDRGRFLVLGDFNAQIGTPDPPHVGQLQGKTTTPNGAATLRIVRELGLWIPSTFEDVHEGLQGTWKHPVTKEEIRLDYVLLDQRLKLGRIRTWVDHGLETAQAGEDHSALALDMEVLHPVTARGKQCGKIDEVAVRDPAYTEVVAGIINSVSAQEWSVNSHDHYARWARDLHDKLLARFPQKRHRPRKHYISDHTWAIRASKMTVRKVLRTATSSFPHQCPALAEQLRLLSRQLKDSLKKDRAWHIDGLLQEVDKAPHGQLFAQLRRLGIGSRFRKSGPRALPMMRREDGTLAEDQAEAQEVWRAYAATLEAGMITTPKELLANCHSRQQQQLQDAPRPHALHFPSLIQLERSCRRIQPFKARGPDGLPGSLFHYFPQLMAKHMRPIMYKMVCNYNEPIGFKGGKLIHLYKGKGDPALPPNRRGILISNHASKVAHNAVRPCYMATLECSMLPMQLGGRRRKSVQQAAHILRLFMSTCRRNGQSCGVVFLDIKTAYYQVIREVVAKNDRPSTFIDDIVARFQLPPGALEKLQHHIDAAAASSQMGLSAYLEHLLAELHSSTWFTVEQSGSLTETRLGTRPGSCFADVLFNLLFSKILHEVHAQLEDAGVMTELQWSGSRGLPDHRMETENCQTAFLAETVWADDLAVFIHHPEAVQLVENLQVTCKLLFNGCLEHGLQPNFAKGKTEILTSLRGKGAVALRRYWFTEQGGVLPIPGCHLQDCHVKLVAQYRHLGGIVNTKGNAKSEVVARVGQMKATFRKYKKTLFTAATVPLEKRSALLRPFVLSILEFNLGTMVDITAGDVQYITTALLQIYRSLVRSIVSKEELYHVSWPWICHALQLPSPSGLLHIARLRYFGQILASGADELWAMVEVQVHWHQECKESFEWLHDNICATSTMPHPTDATKWNEWSSLILKRPKKWKGLLMRAWKHDMYQRYNDYVVAKGYGEFAEALYIADFSYPTGLETQPMAATQHICLACTRSFSSRTGWASHAFKVHGRTHTARQYAHGTQCQACQREFWEYRRLFHHLKYSTRCRARLAQAGIAAPPSPGLNSRHEKRLPSDPLQPWHQCEGPALPVNDYWAGVGAPWDDELMANLMHEIPLDEQSVTISVDDLISQTRSVLVRSTQEFTVVLETLRCWKESMLDVAADEAQSSPPRAGLIRAFYIVMGQLDVVKWLFPGTVVTAPLDNVQWQRVFGAELANHDGWLHIEVPKPLCLEMYVVHLFSGRRRPEDLQAFLEEAPKPQGVLVHVLSADIIFGTNADFSSAKVRRKWLEWISAGFVLALYAGPPCETYSVARAHELAGVSIRPVRSAATPWGFAHLSLREIRQVIVGNILVLFTLQCVILQAYAGRFACGEHPAEPGGSDHASIWRLDIMQHIFRHPRVRRVRVLQGQFGADSPKPTDFIIHGPSDPQAVFKRLATKCNRGTTIGLTADGRGFRTAKLKEYAGPLCRALTAVYSTWLEETGMAADDRPKEPLPPEVVLTLANFVQGLDQCAEHLGPDYNVAACAR